MKVQINTKYWDQADLEGWKERNVNSAWGLIGIITIFMGIALYISNWAIVIIGGLVYLYSALKIVSYNKYRKQQNEQS